MADPVEAKFDAAVNVVRSMPKKGAYQPSYDTMLKFYAFYKQAKEGECCESKPGFWDVVKKAKWEAWHGLEQMSKQEAMELYVSELKKVMQSLPDADKAAEFSGVLESFYKLVYEGQDEQQLPTILKVFEEEKVPHKLKITLKSNGHREPHENENENVPNGYIKIPDVNGTCERFSASVNGFPHQDSLLMKGFPNIDSLDLRNKGGHELNGLQFSHGVNPVLIISPDEFKETEKEEIEDSGFQNGMSEVPPLRPNNADVPIPKGKNGLVLTSDESEEDEFCDTIDPEHLQELQNGNHHEGQDHNLDDTLEQKVNSTQDSNSSGSPEHATNSTLTELSENSDLENDLQSSQLLTSTPYAKHVTFAVVNSESDRPVVVDGDLFNVEPSVSEECFLEETPVQIENGLGNQTDYVVVTEYDSLAPPTDEGAEKPSGILKSHHPVRECGGGDAPQQPSGRSHASRTRQTQGARNKEGSNTVTGASRLPRGHRRRDDSDSEDEFTSDHTSGPDYDSAGDKINDRILQALDRLHQDMKSVLRRLGSIEEAVMSRQDVAPRSEQPWWKVFIPSKPLMFLILWPFIVNIIIFYFKRRKNSQRR